MGDVEVGADGVDDGVWVGRGLRERTIVGLEGVFDESGGGGLLGQAGVSENAVEGTLKFADVGAGMAGEELQRGRLDVRLEVGGFGGENSEARLERWRREVGGKTPVEAGAQPVGEAGKGLRRLVAGEDELLAGGVEVVEGVEELLLGLLLAGEELDVVDQEGLEAAVLGAEVIDASLAGGVDELGGELLGGDVEDAQAGLCQFMADGVDKVRLARGRCRRRGREGWVESPLFWVTARAAAWARRLQSATVKEAKVSRGFSRGLGKEGRETDGYRGSARDAGSGTGPRAARRRRRRRAGRGAP